MVPLPGTYSVLVSLGCHNKAPQTGWLKQQKLTSHSLEAGKSKIKFLAKQAWSLGLLSWLVGGPISLHAHMAFPRCPCTEGWGEQHLWLKRCPPYEDT